WLTAANWSNNTVPTATDTACAGPSAAVGIPSGGATVGWLIDQGTLSVSGGSLTLVGGPFDPGSTPSRVSSVSLTAGVLTGAGTLNPATGTIKLNNGGAESGTLTTSGSGSVAFQNGTFNLASPTLSGTINLFGGLIMTNGDAQVTAGTLALAGAQINGSGTLR